jgi:hypothetical protein
MPRKPRFPPEPETRPDLHRLKGPKAHRSGPAPKDARERSEAPTLPPPRNSTPAPRKSTPAPRKSTPAKGAARPRRSEPAGRNSGIQKLKPEMPAATIDEVTADLSKDPRREHEDDEDD